MGNRLGTINGLGNQLGTVTQANFGVTFADVISQILGLLTAIGALWFVFRFITSAISWISAGGDKQGVENARSKMTQAVIGLGITVAAYALIGLVGAFFGIDIINLNNLIRNLGPK